MRTFRPNPLYQIALAVVLLAAVEILWGHWLTPLSNRLTDVFVRLHSLSQTADPDIVIVDIDEASLARLAPSVGSYPWPRSMHGELVEGIEQQKPKAIVFDLLFTDPDIYRKESDAYFNQVLSAYGNVYTAMLRLEAQDDAAKGIPLGQYGRQIGLEPGPKADPNARAVLELPTALSPQNWRMGIINFREDKDGVGRRYYLYQDAYGWRIPSLPARVAKDLGYAVPDEETLLLDWRGSVRPHTHISYADIYEDFGRSSHQRPQNEFTGKIIIIGTSAPGLHDLRVNPISNVYPGVEILATAIDNLKNGRAMHPAPKGVVMALLVLLLAALLAAFLRGRSPFTVGLGMLAATLVLLGVESIAVSYGWRLPILAPLLSGWLFYVGAALYVYLREKQERQRTLQTFNRFLDPRVVHELVAQGQTAASLNGKSCELTVLFSDIRGFTTLSETRRAQEIVDLLNAYFSRQVEVIFRHNGTLDKFIGDAIMAFWGAPADDERQAEHAVEAALAMVDSLLAFKAELGELGEIFDVGIGIHTGPAVVGFIGSEQRQDYTAIGDTVNLASRIEGQTKGVARVLVSAETAARCGTGRFDFIDHGSYKVKGRAQEVRLFEPRRKTS